MTGVRRERFQRIYELNHTSILGYVLRRTDSAEDAHDIVSETFLTAWRRLDDVPEGERARLWLYGTARRVLANHYRSRQRQQQLVSRLQMDLHRVRRTATEAEVETECIAAAFIRLSGSDQEILMLVGWEELDPDEVAETLGCKPIAARVRLHRARRRFKAQLVAEGVKHQESPGHVGTRRATTRPDTEEAL